MEKSFTPRSEQREDLDRANRYEQDGGERGGKALANI